MKLAGPFVLVAVLSLHAAACGGSVSTEGPADAAPDQSEPAPTPPRPGPQPAAVDASTTMPRDAQAEATAPKPPTPVCTFDRPLKEICYTHDELQKLWTNPPMGGDTARDAGPPPWDPNGCLPAPTVHDDCCQPAIDGPRPIRAPSGPSGSILKCCYSFCVGACC